MLSLSTNYTTGNVVSFTRKRNPETKKQDNQHKDLTSAAPKKGISKSAAALLAASAFMVGVESNNLSQGTSFDAYASQAATELYAPTANGATPKTSNIPPREGKRIYNATRTTTHNGKEYLVKEKYEVFEVKQKIEEDFYEKGTNKLAQHSTYGNYITYPMEQEHKLASGRVIESRRFYNFNRLTCCPESGVIINEDGRQKIDLRYNLDIKTTPIPDEWDEFINSVVPD